MSSVKIFVLTILAIFSCPVIQAAELGREDLNRVNRFINSFHYKGAEDFIGSNQAILLNGINEAKLIKPDLVKECPVQNCPYGNYVADARIIDAITEKLFGKNLSQFSIPDFKRINGTYHFGAFDPPAADEKSRIVNYQLLPSGNIFIIGEIEADPDFEDQIPTRFAALLSPNKLNSVDGLAFEKFMSLY